MKVHPHSAAISAVAKLILNKRNQKEIQRNRPLTAENGSKTDVVGENDEHGTNMERETERYRFTIDPDGVLANGTIVTEPAGVFVFGKSLSRAAPCHQKLYGFSTHWDE